MSVRPYFEALVTLTLDRVILQTVHHSSTSAYLLNVIEIEETLWTYVRTPFTMGAGN